MTKPITSEQVAHLMSQFDEGQHMTGPQVALFLNVSDATVRKWRERGYGPRYHQPAGPNTTATYDPVDVASFALRWNGVGSPKGKTK